MAVTTVMLFAVLIGVLPVYPQLICLRTKLNPLRFLLWYNACPYPLHLDLEGKTSLLAELKAI